MTPESENSSEPIACYSNGNGTTSSDFLVPNLASSFFISIPVRGDGFTMTSKFPSHHAARVRKLETTDSMLILWGWHKSSTSSDLLVPPPRELIFTSESVRCGGFTVTSKFPTHYDVSQKTRVNRLHVIPMGMAQRTRISWCPT